MSTSAACATIMAARTPTDLFGPVHDGDMEGWKTAAAVTYRALAKHAHPDRGGDAAVFQHLQDLYDRARHGDTARPATVTITTKRHTYAVGDRLLLDAVSTTHAVSWMDPNKGAIEGLLRLPKNPRDSDLVEAEVKALKAIRDAANVDGPDVNLFIPTVLDTFRYRGGGGQRRACVLARPAGYYTLSSVPGDLHPKDVAWIWRRLLTALGLAHHAGWVHGSINPDHVLIHPELHGLMLYGWTASVPVGETVPYVDPAWPNLHAPETLGKHPAAPAVDVATAARMMRHMGGSALPRQLRAFAAGCCVSGVPDAWRLLAELDEVLYDLWGARKFHPFAIPGSPTF